MVIGVQDCYVVWKEGGSVIASLPFRDCRRMLCDAVVFDRWMM